MSKLTKLQQIDVKIADSLHRSNYKILIGAGLLRSFVSELDLSKYTQVFVVTEQHLADHFFKSIEEALKTTNLPRHLVCLVGGETNKHISNVEKVWQAMLQRGADRKSLVINLGGGMIGDLGGFAASTYMRGVDFIQCPSTLLSQVDASVGGKVGINLSSVKNAVGSFQQPLAVIIDLDTLKTLPQREFSSGLAEVIKHALIADAEFLIWLEQRNLLSLAQEDLAGMIKHSLKIKATIVEADECESGQRKLLNFGHTAGHAFESLALEAQASLLHGEAISLGMLVEAQLAVDRQQIARADFDRLKNILVAAKLPIERPAYYQEARFFELIAKDKKSDRGSVNWTLLTAVGCGCINQKVTNDELRNALKALD